MNFNSYPFILVFLPIAIVGFFALNPALRPRLSLGWLMALSVLFYGLLALRSLPVILAIILFNYAIARTKAVSFGIFANLVVLLVFKFGRSFGVTFGVPPGISFLTFLQIAFLIDVSRDKELEKVTFLDYVLFALFFPKIISGPIVRIKSFLAQLQQIKNADFSYNLSVGLVIFSMGLFKKMLIADQLSSFIDPIFDAASRGPASFFGAWKAALFYTFQLYFDFSGYSDMAIGLGKMFNIQLPQNFNSPYKAPNIVDFWRRWHITLSDFLRDYIFIPLSVRSTAMAWMYASLFITMTLAGVWHGSGWTFVVWGMLHGTYLCINYIWISFSRERGVFFAQNGFALFAARAITFVSVVIGWVIFRAADLGTAGRMLKGMIFLSPTLDLFAVWNKTSTAALVWLVGLFVVVFLAPNTQQIMAAVFQNQRDAANFSNNRWWQWKPTMSWSFVTSFLLFIDLMNVGHLAPFIYFQF